MTMIMVLINKFLTRVNYQLQSRDINKFQKGFIPKTCALILNYKVEYPAQCSLSRAAKRASCWTWPSLQILPQPYQAALHCLLALRFLSGVVHASGI